MPVEGLVSIVIPVYRSGAYLERTVDGIRSAFERHGPFEMILVNDGSPDDVQDVIRRLHAGDPRVRYIELGANQGQHAATLKGLAVARGDIVVTLDDDGQNPPEAGLAVVDALRGSRLDVVYGRYRTMRHGRFRVIASAVNRWLTRRTIGNTPGVSISSVRAIRGDLARALGRARTWFPYLDGLVFAATRRIGEVEVEHRARAEGTSGYSLGSLLALWTAHLTTLSVFPLRVASATCLIVAAAGMVIGAVQMVRALVGGHAPEGWLSLFTAVTFLFALLFVMLAILSAYLGRMYVSQNARGLDWIRSCGGIHPDEDPR